VAPAANGGLAYAHGEVTNGPNATTTMMSVPAATPLIPRMLGETALPANKMHPLSNAFRDNKNIVSESTTPPYRRKQTCQT
jgi:hypothetical protein